MIGEEKIIDCIKNTISSLKLQDVEKKWQIDYELDYKELATSYISRWNYIWNMYQSIEGINNCRGISKTSQVNIDLWKTEVCNIKLQLPSLIEFIYKEAVGEKNIDTLCTGQIYLKDNILNDFDYLKEPEKFNLFLDEFYKRITSSKCKFTSLALNIRSSGFKFSHRNMLLIYKDRQKIYVSLYEPHGDSENTRFVNNFIDYLVLSFNRRFFDINYKMEIQTYSCRMSVMKAFRKILRKDIEARIVKKEKIKGIQDIIKEPGEGYCVMYSYFWLYLVLKCYQKYPINIDILIDTIETSLVKMYSPIELTKIITGFASKIVNSYIETISIQFRDDKETLKNFFRKIDKDFRQNMYREKLLITEEIGKHHRKRPKKERLKEFGERCDIDIECASKNCENKKCGLEKAEISLKKDNERCINSDECMSSICYRGKCVPHPINYIKRDGEKCKNSYECISNFCRSEICQSNEQSVIGPVVKEKKKRIISPY